MGDYSIHLTFADGSNPYVRYRMTRSQYNRELRKWRKHYDITGTMTRIGIYFGTATIKA